MTTDRFARRTAEPAVVLPWLLEIARTLPGLVSSYAIGGPIDPRTRQRIIIAVTEVNGCRYCAWIHGSWQAFLGEVEPAEAEPVLLAYASECAKAGEPLPTDDLLAVLPAEAVCAVRATVAHSEVASLVGNTVDGVVARLTGRRPLAPFALARELGTIAAAAPIAVPLVGAAAVMRLLRQVAPPLPDVEMPPDSEANLLVHLLSSAAPTYLANAAVRLLALGGPLTFTIGVRAGRSTATVRLGRGRVAIDNGIAEDAVVVIEGEVEPLLELATGSIVRELRNVRLRPN